jgi:hypothetical protein
MAIKARYLNTEELLSRLSVPHADIIETAGSEEFRVAVREGNVVDTLVVTGVTELRSDVVSVTPVDGSLGGSTEEVSGVGSE